MKIRNASATVPAVGSFSRPPAHLDRALPVSPLIAKIGRTLSLLLDAHCEAQNNTMRGETHFLRQNLAAVFALAKRIHSRRKSAARLLAKTTGGR